MSRSPARSAGFPTPLREGRGHVLIPSPCTTTSISHILALEIVGNEVRFFSQMAPSESLLNFIDQGLNHQSQQDLIG